MRFVKKGPVDRHRQGVVEEVSNFRGRTFTQSTLGGKVVY